MRAGRVTKEEVLKDFRTAEIVRAARRVIGGVGFADTSMERIAHEAGVAKGTIYLYFRNKDELLAHVVRHGFHELMERARSDTARAAGTEAKLEALLRALLEHTSQNHEVLRALHERAFFASQVAPGLSAVVERNLAELVGFVAELIERGAARGEVRACDSRRAAAFLVDSMRGALLERLRERSPTSVQADAAAIVDFFLHGVGVTESR